jgi:hypothetical protein
VDKDHRTLSGAIHYLLQNLLLFGRGFCDELLNQRYWGRVGD